MNLDQKRISKVLERLKDLVEDDADLADGLAEGLEELLDQFHGEDAFGTEGQIDPRGDFRTAQWSLTGKLIEGIDEPEEVDFDEDEEY